MQSVHTLLKFAQLRWTGHVTRMPDELQVGKRSHGGQKKRYKDTLKASLKDISIPTESWEQFAQDRIKWRGLMQRGAGEYEAKRISEAEQKRAQRKARAKASPTELSSSDLSCSICNRQFRAKIGLKSHLRAHKYSRLSLSRTPRDSMKHFEISVLRHIRFAELRKTINLTTTFNRMSM